MRAERSSVNEYLTDEPNYPEAVHNRLDTRHTIRHLHSVNLPSKLPLVCSNHKTLSLSPSARNVKANPPPPTRQSYIERLLPGETFVLHPADETPEKSSEPPKPPRVVSYLNIPNTIAKFLIDQSLCASVNTVAFITAMAYFKGKPTAEVVQVVQRDFWPLLTAGWRLWPVVSLTNYAVIKDIPTRTLVGNMAGVAWNVYLSLVSGGK
jgi:protein Mpv17